MEVSGMDESKKIESHLTSPAAFVEGGIQEACDDACSICLEAFCESDPSTVTSCKHEFHLQCVLEWCQRSSQCPMCWQSISLKDPTSQELLEAVERERSIRLTPSRNATIFHHPALGDFELQHLPVDANDEELEERILQHLAAAAAMGRAHHIARRGGHRNRLSAQGHSQFLVFSHSNTTLTDPASTSASPTQTEGETEPAAAITAPSMSADITAVGEEPSQQITQLSSAQRDQNSASESQSSILMADRHGASPDNRHPGSQSSPSSQDRAGPSEFQAFSESLKSRFNAVSSRYKESISKSTRGWKERFFSRNTSMAELGSEVKREVNAGIASVSRLMERLETRESGRPVGTSVSNNLEDSSVANTGNLRIEDTRDKSSLNEGSKSASCAASSGSN